MKFGGEAATLTRDAPTAFNAENPGANVVSAINMREHIVREKFVEIEKAKACPAYSRPRQLHRV